MSNPATHIASTPSLGWCPSCGESWRPDMVAVNVFTARGWQRICDRCVAQAHELAQQERQRRDDEERARRQE